MHNVVLVSHRLTHKMCLHKNIVFFCCWSLVCDDLPEEVRFAESDFLKLYFYFLLFLFLFSGFHFILSYITGNLCKLKLMI